jgi:AraC-like DNA-binding protein
MGMAFSSMSQIYYRQRRFAEQEKCLRECIELMRDSTYMLNLVANAYNNLGYCLIAQERYDEAIRIADEAETVVRNYELYSRSPQPHAWRNLYDVYLEAFLQSGRFDEAEHYCNKIDSISGGTENIFEAKAAIYASRGQYADALEMIDKALESVRPTGKISVMGAKMMILFQKHNVPDVELLYREIIDAIDANHNVELNAQLDEIRTQYEVDKIEAEKERIRNYLLFSFGGCLLLTVLLGVYIYYNRLIQKKNRGLYRQIKEQDALVESFKHLAQHYEALAQTVSPNDEPETLADLSEKLRGDRQQRKIVAQFEEYLLKDRRFADVELNLDNVIVNIATNRKYFYEAIKAVTDQSPTEYIRTMQLEEAKKMLETNFEQNIEVIAELCGFNSRVTFYRLFRQRYQINPVDYRKLAKEKV